MGAFWSFLLAIPCCNTSLDLLLLGQCSWHFSPPISSHGKTVSLLIAVPFISFFSELLSCFMSSVRHFLAASRLSHAGKSQEKPLGPGYFHGKGTIKNSTAMKEPRTGECDSLCRRFAAISRGEKSRKAPGTRVLSRRRNNQKQYRHKEYYSKNDQVLS